MTVKQYQEKAALFFTCSKKAAKTANSWKLLTEFEALLMDLFKAMETWDFDEEPRKKKRPVRFKFPRCELIFDTDPWEEGCGLGLAFTDKKGVVHRQAVRIPLGTSMKDAGKFMKQLGEFFISPDKRMVTGCRVLRGNELNAKATS